MTTIDRIQLTADADLRAKLRRKREEYMNRLAIGARDSSLRFKIIVLEALFERGYADIQALRDRYAAAPSFDGSAFDEAVDIIAAYNDNQPARLAGGTGLQ